MEKGNGEENTVEETFITDSGRKITIKQIDKKNLEKIVSPLKNSKNIINPNKIQQTEGTLLNFE